MSQRTKITMSRHTRLASTKASPQRAARADRNRMGRAKAREDDLAVAQIRAARLNYRPAEPQPRGARRPQRHDITKPPAGPRDWVQAQDEAFRGDPVPAFRAADRPPSAQTAITTMLTWTRKAQAALRRADATSSQFRRRGR
jgi:hypothetical protein